MNVDSRSLPVQGTQKQILGLDLLRFLAAMLVMFLHLGILRSGWIGIQIFFVLSGIVITYSAQNAAPLQFLISRVARLVPAVLICASMSFAFRLWLDGYADEFLVGYLHSLIFWPSPPWISIVYWTLHVEVGFYALVLIVLALGSSRYLLHVAIIVGAWSTVYNCAPSMFVMLPSWIRQVTLAELGCFFSLGIFVYFSTQKQQLRPAIAVLLIALSLPACALEIEQYAWAERSSVAQAELWFFVIAALMLLSTQYDKMLWRVAGGFSGQIRVLGLITYPLYLIHYSLIELTERSLPIEPKLARIIGAAISLITASVIAVYVEPSVRRPIRTLASTLALKLGVRPAYCGSPVE